MISFENLIIDSNIDSSLTPKLVFNIEVRRPLGIQTVLDAAMNVARAPVSAQYDESRPNQTRACLLTLLFSPIPAAAALDHSQEASPPHRDHLFLTQESR